MDYYFPSNINGEELKNLILTDEDLRIPVLFSNSVPMLIPKNIYCHYEQTDLELKCLACSPVLPPDGNSSVNIKYVPYHQLKTLGADLALFGPDFSRPTTLFLR